MTTPDAATILDALTCGRPGCECHASARKGRGRTHCPAHADSKPSLSVTPKDGTVTVLVKCFGGCTQEDVLAMLRARGLWPERTTNGARPAARETRYPVLDPESGAVVAIHVRLDRPGEAKYMWWERPDRTRGLNGRKPVELPLYGAHELRDLASGAAVVLTEGEKARDALAGRGIAAVATVCGASSTPCDEALRPLATRPVILWPDNDAVGAGHMRKIAARLQALGCADVSVVRWSEAPPAGDAADFAGSDEELRTLIEAAEPFKASAATTPAHGAIGAVTVRLADVAPERVAWRWSNRLPLGKLTIIEGDPGVGKSHVSLAIATAVTLGAPLPGDTERWSPADVLILSAEDGAADTLRPRLEAMGADLTRVRVLTAVRGVDGREHFPSLVDDLPSVDELLGGGGFELVIVDPINAYLGGVDGFKDIDVRSALGPLGAMAERHNVSLVVIRHLTKGARDRAIYRGAGSIAYSAAARSVLLVGANPRDPRERAVVCTKHNLAPDSPAIGFQIDAGRFLWRGESALTAADLLAPDPGPGERAEDTARDFLREALAGGARLASDILAEAIAAGIAERTLNRAKKALGIVATHEGERGRRGGGKWSWSLPSRDEVSRLPDPECVEVAPLTASEPTQTALAVEDGTLNRAMEVSEWTG